MKALAVMLLVLVGPWLTARVLAPRLDLRFAGSLGVSLLFLITGTAHFTHTTDFVAMLPPWVPLAKSLVWSTGLIEMLLAVCVLPSATRRMAGMMIVVMLVVFAPVNIHAALSRAPVGGHEWGWRYLLLRVPVQIFIGWWVWLWVIRTSEVRVHHGD